MLVLAVSGWFLCDSMSAKTKVQCPRCKKHFSNFSLHITWCTEPEPGASELPGSGRLVRPRGWSSAAKLERGGAKVERKPQKVGVSCIWTQYFTIHYNRLVSIALAQYI